LASRLGQIENCHRLFSISTCHLEEANESGYFILRILASNTTNLIAIPLSSPA